MRVLLIFSISYFLYSSKATPQISEFPYHQGFENQFLEFGNNAIFIDSWSGNQVKETNSRIFHSDKYSRNGKYSLGVQPISSFDGNITIDLDLTDHEHLRVHFYARSIKNGSGSRPILVRISTSIDGGESYIKRENIGDETSFPNEDTEFALYIYDLPASASRMTEVKLKLEILYTSAFGTGSAARFIMEDFAIYEKEKDLKIVEVLQPDAETLQVVFNQQIDKESAENNKNYTLGPTNTIILAARNERSKNQVNLKLSQELKVGNHQLMVNGILNFEKDIILEQENYDFTYYPPPAVPKFNELLITEIMADPDPPVGLPISEYIEIYNPTEKTLTLKDITFSDASTTTKLPEVLMIPGAYLLVVPKTKIDLFEGITPLIGISSWPSLNVGGDQLTLSSPDGDLIFSVSYEKSWYKETHKSEGGWSLEMRDIASPCGGKKNWAASKSKSGGTPAKENSIQELNPDISLPKINESIAIKNNQILLKFNEKILPEAIEISNFEIIPTIRVKSVELITPSLSSIILTLEDYLKNNTVYEIIINNLKDCAGNSIAKNSTIHFGLPEPADSLDIVINEVLFNARTGGVKFVEVYNNSHKFINLKNWQLGNDIDFQNSSFKSITNEDYILEPHSYLAISHDNEKLKSEYPRGKEENFYQISSLPSYTISEGTVVLHDEKGDVIDYFSYSEDFHSALLRNTKGVSLERISFGGMSNHSSNWQSAASTVGFATPGYKNSQSNSNLSINEKFAVTPKVFIPENSGIADYTNISYKLSKAGYYGTLKIFDTKGNLIKGIAKNEQLPIEGFFTWDGTDDNNRKVRIGYYMVYFELYNLNGTTEILKETVVVGKRF